MTTTRPPGRVRGYEDRDGAYCIAGDADTWPGSCCAPATHVLRLEADAHGLPYETHRCSRHPSSSGVGSTERYRTDAEALAALPLIERLLEQRTHPNDYPAALERFYAAARHLRGNIDTVRAVSDRIRGVPAGTTGRVLRRQDTDAVRVVFFMDASSVATTATEADLEPIPATELRGPVSRTEVEGCS